MRGGKLHSVRAEELRAGLLQHDDSVPVPGTAAEAEGSAAQLVKVSAGLHARGDPRIGRRSKSWEFTRSWRRRDTTAHGPGFSGEHGEYEFPSRPEEPAVLFMLRTPCMPGLPARDQHRAGRGELMVTPYSKFEREHSRPIGADARPGRASIPRGTLRAITVNRWAHGYAFTPNSLFDPPWKSGEQPWIVGTKTIWKNHDCEFGCGCERLHGRGDRSGAPSH